MRPITSLSDQTPIGLMRQASVEAGTSKKLKVTGMTVKELMELLAKHDPSALVVISSHDGGEYIAAVDSVRVCTVQKAESSDQFGGDYRLAHEGVPAAWLGWSKGFNTDYTVAYMDNPKDEWPWV